MSRRANQPDTAADLALRACIDGAQKRSFVMVAGAGSGKTTSLIKALSGVVATHGAALKKRRQKVACITYTEVAAGEIWADVGSHGLVHVSTIHSFLWLIAKTFQGDIRTWVQRRLDEKIADLVTAAAEWGPRVRDATKAKNQNDQVRYAADKARLAEVRTFNYGTGSDYPKGILGHDDILKLGASFLQERPLFRRLVAQQFPFVFIDESQDTTAEIVSAFKAVDAQQGGDFCLGFFGDPMQKIYPTGIGDIALEDGWALIQKPENFRCPQTVLRVANAIRRGGDGLVQVGGRTETVAGGVDRQFVEGSTRIFVLLADERRDERLAEVRRWVAARSDDDLWEPGPESPVKVLVIVHRMAANRLGFSTLYAAMNDKAPEAFKSGFLDATAWPLRPLVSFALPLSQAMGEGREFDAIQLLRAHSPLLAKASLKGKDIAVLLAQLRRDAQRLTTLMREGTVGDVFQHLARSGLMELDVRITSHLEVRGQARALEETEEPEEANREVDAMGALFRCPATELSSYLGYVEDESPFSTQQGVKGAEFSEVLVVLDDDEGTHMQFSYDKYFGVKPPSDADRRNIEAGRETTVDRTRRLFYVCCTRALRDLVVVYFSTDPALAARQVRASEIFPEDMIFTDADLAG